MKSLKQIWTENQYPTDKEHLHHYLDTYDQLFSPYRFLGVNILEIGYLDGGSLNLWEDYFPYAQIRGIDITDQFRQDKGVPFKTDRVKLEIKDSMTLNADYFKDFPPDIVIDDGCHICTYQHHTVRVIYPVLRAGGILVIEDFGSPEMLLKGFEDIGYPFEVIDLRHYGKHDNMLLVYRK